MPLSNSALYKQIGRLTYLLSSVFVAVLSRIALYLLQTHQDSKHLAPALEYALVVLGVFWIRSLERRLMDARLPRWSFWPYFLLVITACFGLFVLGILNDARMLELFIALQVPAALFPSKPAADGALPQSAGQAGEQGYPYSGYNQPLGRFQFPLRVLLIAALCGALFHWTQRMPQGVDLWEMRLGIVLLAFVWIYCVEGRVMDAGLPRLVSVPYCFILPGACVLPVFLHVIGTHVALALFVVLQVPTIFFHGRAIPTGQPPLGAGRLQPSGLPATRESKPVRQATTLSGFEFAVYSLLIAGLWEVLHLLRGDIFGSGARSLALNLALDACSLFICILWIISVHRRLRDAGRPRWTGDFCLLVLAICLLPIAFKVMSFQQALVLFATLQIPAVFFRPGSIPAKSLPADKDS